MSKFGWCGCVGHRGRAAVLRAFVVLNVLGILARILRGGERLRPANLKPSSSTKTPRPIASRWPLAANDIDVLLNSPRYRNSVRPTQGNNKVVVIYHRLPRGGGWSRLENMGVRSVVLQLPKANRDNHGGSTNLWRGTMATHRLSGHRAFPRVLGWCKGKNASGDAFNAGGDERDFLLVASADGGGEGAVPVCGSRAVRSLVETGVANAVPALVVVSEAVGDETFSLAQLESSFPRASSEAESERMMSGAEIIRSRLRVPNVTKGATAAQDRGKGKGCAICDRAGPGVGSSAAAAAREEEGPSPFMCRAVWTLREVASLLLHVTHTRGAALLTFELTALRLAPGTCSVYLVDNDHVYFPDSSPEYLNWCFRYHTVHRREQCATVDWCNVSADCDDFKSSHYGKGDARPLRQWRSKVLANLVEMVRSARSMAEAGDHFKTTTSAASETTCPGWRKAMVRLQDLEELLSNAAGRTTIDADEMLLVLRDFADGLDCMRLLVLPHAPVESWSPI